MATYFVLCFALASGFISVNAENRMTIGCIERLPEDFSNALTSCKFIPPKSIANDVKNSKEPLVTKCPAHHPKEVDKKMIAALKCAVGKIGMLSDTGVSAAGVRRIMDDHYPGKTHHHAWRGIKKCASIAEDKILQKEEEVDCFLKCLTNLYGNVCVPAS